MAEPVEQLHLFLGIAADLVVLREVLHEGFDPRAELVREVGGRRPDELVDVVAGDLSHDLSLIEPVPG
jgi:hypothetical protein